MCMKPVRILVLAVLLAALGAPAVFAETTYTAYNLWYEATKEQVMQSTHYKKGIMIPAGTEVKDVAVTSGKRAAISFKTAKDGKAFRIQFNARHHPGVTPQAYADKLFTAKNFDELTKGMTAEEVSAIKEGKLVVGMSKAAVIMAYGYPPEHATSSTEANTWTVWLDRFRMKTINFDDNGRMRDES